MRESIIVKRIARPIPITVAVLVLVAVAFAVRTLTLNQQSLWMDEVYSIWFVDRPLADAWAVGVFPDQNPHAPLYYLVLWAWLKFAGTSDFAVRYLSLWCGVLTVAAVWRGSRDWLGRRFGLLVTLLFTCAPFAIYFAQEARMYSMYLMFAALSFMFMVRVLKPGAPWKDWLGFALSSVGLAYSDFFGVFTVAAQYLIVLVVAWPARASRTKEWTRRYLPILVSGACAALVCLPIPIALLKSGRTYSLQSVTAPALPMDVVLRELLSEYATRVRWADLPASGVIAVLAPMAVLLAAGIVMAWRKSWRHGMVVTGLLVLPVAVYSPFWQTVGVFQPRYLMPLFLAFILGLAVALIGVMRRWRWAGFVLAVAVVSYFAVGYLRDLTRPEFQREDWRFTADYLRRMTDANDRVVIFADYMEPVLKRYYDGPAPVVPFAFGMDTNNPGPFFDSVQAPEEVRTIWLVLSHDLAMAPDHRLLDTAYARYPWVRAQYPTSGNIRILAFTPRWRSANLPLTAVPVTYRFANGLELIGYHVDYTRLSPREYVSHPPSNWIHVITYWRRWGPVDLDNVHPQARLVDAANGEWGGDLPRSPDVFDFDPPAGWPTEAIIEAHMDVNLNPITPAGLYRLNVALAREGQRLPLQDGSGDTVLLTPVEIIP